MSYPFWLKNRADRSSSDAWQARNQADKAKDEKEKYQKTIAELVKEVESVLDDFKKEDNPDKLIAKLKESIKKFKE